MMHTCGRACVQITRRVSQPQTLQKHRAISNCWHSNDTAWLFVPTAVCMYVAGHSMFDLSA